MKPRVITETGGQYDSPPENGKEYTLEEMQKTVGGYIQVLNLGDGTVLVINEEGKLHGLKVNVEATSLAAGVLFAGDCIVGPAMHIPEQMLK